MYYYMVYGREIDSDLFFPQLVKIDCISKERADIIIRAGSIPEELKNREPEKKYEFGEKFSWLINRTLWLMVEEGNKITYEIRTGGTESNLRSYLLGFGLSLVFMQRNQAVMHCSAVSKDEDAVLICGESGSGKSTLTTMFLEAGYELMGDDTALVVEEENVIVYPCFPYQKLCRDAAIKKGFNLDELIYIDEDKDKFMVPYKGVFSVQGKIVKAMFYLQKSDDIDSIYTEEVKGISKFYLCVNNLFVRKLLVKNKYTCDIAKVCLQLSAKIPMFGIVRTSKKDTIIEIWEYVKKIIKDSV